MDCTLSPSTALAADPERLHSRGPTPTALLIEDRIAARNREAVRLGVRRFMNAKEALLQTPALQLERSGQLIGQELSSILLSIAQSFGAALLLQAPNSGAAAIIVNTDQSAAQLLLDTVLRLKFEAFGGSGSSPLNALNAAVEEAKSVHADYDAQALLMHTVLKENLIASMLRKPSACVSAFLLLTSNSSSSVLTQRLLRGQRTSKPMLFPAQSAPTIRSAASCIPRLYWAAIF